MADCVDDDEEDAAAAAATAMLIGDVREDCW